MWTSLALVTALGMAPNQAAEFKLTNTRTTYGELGATRPDTKYLPGDIYFVSYDIEGITVDPEGKVKYNMEMEVVDAKGKAIFKQAAQDRDDYIVLGGNKLPARAFITIGTDQAPGLYTCKVKVVDLVTKASRVLEQKFEIIPKKFGIVKVLTSADRDAKIPAPAMGVEGQSIFVHFALLGFSRDPAKKQPNLEVEMTITDSDGKPTLAKAPKTTIDKVEDDMEDITHLEFILPMNRAGDFMVELKATDKVTKQVSSVKFPFKVLNHSGK